MIRSLLVAGLVLMAPLSGRAETNHFAQGGRFGLGLGGTNLVSGLTGKLFIAPPVALQATVGFWYGYGRYSGLDIALDGIVEMPSFYSNGSVNLNWNLGGGATIVVGSPFLGGIQGIAGLGLQIKPVPIEVVLELRPTFLFPQAGYFYFGGGAAIRYFFGR